MTDYDVSGKRIMITGASSGLGMAIAQLCVTAGGQVTSLDVQPPAQAHNTIDYVPFDVSDNQQWLVIRDKHPAPDVLFLNAGVMSAPNGSSPGAHQFLNSTPETYELIRGVNLDGVVLGLQTLVPVMSGGSCIIVTASLAGLNRYTYDPLYAATKHALVGLVKSLADELKTRDIRIHAFCPNRIETPLLPAATRTSHDLSPQQAAEAAVSLVQEPSSGYAWALEQADQPLRRYPAPPASIWSRIKHKLS